jgi:RNA polymerase sigma factor (sigma-70 family)
MSQLPLVSDARAKWLMKHALPLEPGLRTWLSSRSLPGIEIDDVVQETYCRLIQVADVDAIRSPKSYIFQAAFSVLVSHARRGRVVSMQALADIEELGLQVDTPSPEQQAIDRDELYRLAQAMAMLPGKIGEVFRLRRVHGLAQRDVALRLGLAESTVEKHMRRGLLLLLQHFTRGGNSPSQASKAGEEPLHSVHDQNTL